MMASTVCLWWWKQALDGQSHTWCPTQNSILGFEKQILLLLHERIEKEHGTPERINSENETHFSNYLIDI